MVDFLGQRLKPGDYIVAATSMWSFRTGKIIKLSDKTVRVEWHSTKLEKKRENVYPFRLIKVENEAAVLCNLRNKKSKF